MSVIASKREVSTQIGSWVDTSRRKRRTFVLNSTLIVFVEYSFSHVPLPYNKFHVSLKGCSQIIEIGTFING